MRSFSTASEIISFTSLDFFIFLISSFGMDLSMVSHLMVPRPKIRCMNDLSNVRSRIRYRRISSSLVDNIPVSTINFSSVQMYFVKLKGNPKNKLLFLSVQIVAIHRSSFSLRAFPVYRIKLFILLYILLLKMKTATS